MSKPDPQVQPPRHPDLTLADLTAALLWPRLFDAARLAMRPERMLLALATVVTIGLLGSVSLLWHDGLSFGQEIGILFTGWFESIVRWLDSLSLARPWDLQLGMLVAGMAGFWEMGYSLVVRSFPLSSIILGLPMLAVALVGWGAISRSAAFEFGLGTVEPGPVLVAKAVSRLPSLAGATLGLPVFVGVVALGMGAVGWLLLGLPVVNILGAVLFGGALLIALILVPLWAAWCIGFPMLAPAVMCEGPDAFEALQRAMAYIFAKPLRYLVYFVILLAVGVVMVTILMLILAGADALATGAATLFLDPETAAIVTGVAAPGPDAELTGSAVAAARIIIFWKATLGLILGAFIVSYAASASSVLYLAMRSLVDGQDPGDLASEIGTPRG
jgi:hypothetical protein